MNLATPADRLFLPSLPHYHFGRLELSSPDGKQTRHKLRGHVILDTPFQGPRRFQRAAGDALCKRRQSWIDECGQNLDEIQVAQSDCRVCLDWARELWFQGSMHSAVAIFYHKRKVLSIGRRNDHGDLGFPGGKLNDGETPLDAVVREVREETGIVVEECVPIMDAPAAINDAWSMAELYEGRHARLTRAYMVTKWQGIPGPLEGMPVKWVPAARMLSTRNSFSGYNHVAFRMAGVR